jgi:late competence protein required for DNA uptake (superfamily II DNA/RNA helicase)
MKKIGISTTSCERCEAWTTEIIKVLPSGKERLYCPHCGHMFLSEPSKSLTHLYRVEKVRYPQINGSLGCVVKSRDHENHVAKKLGMTPTDHIRVKGSDPVRKPKGKVYANPRGQTK